MRPSTWTRLSTAVALTAAATLATGAVVAHAADVPTATVQPTPVVSEDAPGWDCRTQGNHACGVTLPTPDGAAYVLIFDATGTRVVEVWRQADYVAAQQALPTAP